MSEGDLNVGVADAGQALARGAARVDGRQTSFRVAVMLLEVPCDQSLNGKSVLAVEVATGYEEIGHRSGFVAGPSLEGGDELALVDQAILQGEEAEKQIA
jgi:hypothetical protein